MSNEKQNRLAKQLDALAQRQELLANEIAQLRNELQTTTSEHTVVSEAAIKGESENLWNPPKLVKKSVRQRLNSKLPDDLRHYTEKFIGENLISIIGIIILVIGVGIGAKYAIDRQMISPTMRLIAGYLVAIALMGFAIKLKPAYKNFSAILLSGALAIMYFLTYAAYDFYELIPKLMAFVLMVLFTVFTTLAALKYRKQIIAHIGFVGAYGVPFLVSDGSGSVTLLLAYVALVNLGVLAVSLKQYWKSLYYTAFAFTWSIYLAAYSEKLHVPDDLNLLLLFLTLYFLTFYAMFVGYKIVNNEGFKRLDIFLVLANSFVTYGIGYHILSNFDAGKTYLGLFTIAMGVVHFGVALLLKSKKLADRNLFYLALGLVLTFITIAVPVQLNGHWITLMWLGEAIVLTWIGKKEQLSWYQKMAHPLIVLTLISLFQDWDEAYSNVYNYWEESTILAFFNSHFLASILSALGFGVLVYLHFNKNNYSVIYSNNNLNRFIAFFISGAFLFSTYLAFELEIANYWNHVYYATAIMVTNADLQQEELVYNPFVKDLGAVWSFVYTLFFLSILALVNIKLIKNKVLAKVNVGIAAFVILLFLVQGLFYISKLRSFYLHPDLVEGINPSKMYVLVRYIALLFLGGLVFACYSYIKRGFVSNKMFKPYMLALATIGLWISSSELIHWLDVTSVEGTYKLGLSILWGAYAMLLVGIGIYKRFKYLRIAAIGLFGLTLLKLFFYDMYNLSTISKTIVFVVLGVLLLIISFLYNKFKHLILPNQLTSQSHEKN